MKPWAVIDSHVKWMSNLVRENYDWERKVSAQHAKVHVFETFSEWLLSSIIIYVSVIVGILTILVLIVPSLLWILCSDSPFLYDQEAEDVGHLYH